MLAVEGLTKTFYPNTPNAVAALRGISFTLRTGEFATVVGSNGAGKSTLLNAIAGVFPADAGRIRIGGRDCTALPDYRRANWVARVFQDPLRGTAGGLSIEENLALAGARGRRRGLRLAVSPRSRQEYRELLSRLGLGLEHRLHDRVGLLSGGQRQALSLLMATLTRPEILLLDEHTSALDPRMADLVADLTARFVAEQGLTALMVTHNLNQAIRMGDRLLLMHQGQVVLDLSGPEKQSLTVEALRQKFELVRGESFADDRAVLGS